MMTTEKVKTAVKEFMRHNVDGHGWDHVDRVCRTAEKLCATEQAADREIVLLAALLHDCDDYKLVGKEKAGQLLNAKRIMSEAGVEDEKQEKVCQIISHMGYSKALKGICPDSLEGRIVSDADMLDAAGAVAVVRALTYTLTSGSGVVFDSELMPEQDLSAENYTRKDRRTDSFINHFFDKLLKLKEMMFLEASRQEAEIRQKTMVDFLEAFFREQDLPQWQKLLEPYR